MGDDDQQPPEDPAAEVKAMGVISEALAPISAAGKVRVLRWAGDLYGVGLSSVQPRMSAKSTASPASDPSTAKPSQAVEAFGDLADFYTAARPETDAHKALVVAYWHQKQGGEDIDSQAVNTELKHLGFGIGNITRAFTLLKDSRPALLVQLRKEGQTRQARKKFKVTMEGQREVERMLAANGS